MTEVTNEPRKQVDVLVIGAGPGGLSAALYASRANLSTIILDKGAPGGEVLNTSEVENYPGFSLISGPELAEHLFNSATRFGARYEYGDVTHIEPGTGRHTVYTTQTIYEAKAVIIATGSHHRKLNVPGEKELSGQGTSYCAVCDGFFFKDRELIVVGGGDSAVEEGTFLTQFASKVTIVHRRDTLRAQQVLQDRAFNNDKVDFIWDSTVEKINGENQVESVTIKNLKTGETYDHPTDGVFIYVGILPNSKLVEGLDITDEEGWIITDNKMSTSIPGIYAVGDVRQTPLRQIATAVGDGSHAGHFAYDYIQTLDN